MNQYFGGRGRHQYFNTSPSDSNVPPGFRAIGVDAGSPVLLNESVLVGWLSGTGVRLFQSTGLRLEIMRSIIQWLGVGERLWESSWG